MHANIFSPTYLIANVISLVVLIAAIFWPLIARFLLALIFIGAAFFNAVMAIREPELFMVYGAMTVSPVYEQFIYGAFRDNITAIVVSISICQLAAGVFIAARGALMKLGLLAATTFLIAIAPLGAGSAFPSTLLLAAAAIVLLFKERYLSAHPLQFGFHHFLSGKKNEI
ncbi:hypothetical protein MRBLMN1_002513 [Chitinophaga ginsengisegetis]|uniref:hypothetical protein n=1 Tax=Chitinophaga ginsengisegetis TaxID=393003 RepID=UPI0034319F61